MWRVTNVTARLSLLWTVLIALAVGQAFGQSNNPADGSTATTQGTLVPRLIQFSGVLKDKQNKPLTGVQGVTFALYKEQNGGASLWIETQNVQTDFTGAFTVLLGASSPQGLPMKNGVPVKRRPRAHSAATHAAPTERGA